MNDQTKNHATVSTLTRVLTAAAILAATSGLALAQQTGPDNGPAGTKRIATQGRLAPNLAQDQPETNQPETDDEALPETGLEDKGEFISFAAFSDPLELATLVDYVGSALGINIIIKGTLNGTVTFNAPIDVPKAELMDLLDAILEQYSFSITQDASGIYTVQASNETPVTFGGDRATSKIIDTMGLRPTGLQEAIKTILDQGSTSETDDGLAFIDELGVIVMTGTPRNIARVEEIIADLQKRYLESRFSRIELDHIAAPVARERVIQLVGGA